MTTAACSSSTSENAPASTDIRSASSALPPSDVSAIPGTKPNAACVPFVSSAACAWNPHLHVTPEAAIDANVPSGFKGAALAMDGDVLVVGAYRESDDEKGAVYVFRRASDGWRREARLVDERSSDHDLFGAYVAVSGDTLICSSARGVHMYKHILGAWVSQPLLFRALFPNVITSVALRGSTAMVGVLSGVPYGACFWYALVFERGRDGVWRNGTVDGGEQCGGPIVALAPTAALIVNGGWSSVRALARRDGQWVDDGVFSLGDEAKQEERLTLAMSADGKVAALGLPGAERTATHAGAVRVYRRNTCGWEIEAELTASKPVDFGEFGSSVALGDDALVIGASIEGQSVPRNSWRALVYVRGPEGWRASKSFEGPDGFGSSVALANGHLIMTNGDRLLPYEVALRCMPDVGKR